VLYLDKEMGLIAAQTLYPNAVNAIWLLCLMRAILRTIQEKKLFHEPFVHHSLLNYVGELTKNLLNYVGELTIKIAALG
jgi:hypothetical protein